MKDYLPILIVTVILFSLCFAAMSVRLIVKGKTMRGGCGSDPVDNNDEEHDCDFCSKKKINLCECDGQSSLVDASNTASLGRLNNDNHSL